MKFVRPELRIVIPPPPLPTFKTHPPGLPRDLLERIVITALDSNFKARMSPDHRNADM